MSNNPIPIKPPTIDIWQLIIDILQKNKEDFLKKPGIQDVISGLEKIKTSVEDLNPDDFVKTIYETMEKTITNLKDFFFNIIKSNIEQKLEDHKIKISEKLKLQGKPQEEIDVILKQLSQLSDLTDLNGIDFSNLKDIQKIIEEFILKKLKIIGVTDEKEIAEVLTKLVNNLIGASINDAVASGPITLLQILASLFPFGTEPLVAVNKLNDVITQFTQILIDKVMDGAVDAIEIYQVPTNIPTPIPTNGGKRKKKKRKSKSKHFYINRIRQTLKQFYNY
jgi:hypothetical protein